MLASLVLVVFLGKDFDDPPVGFTRRHMLMALARYLAERGGLVLCLDRPLTAVTTLLQQKRKVVDWLRGKRGLRKRSLGMYLYTPWMFFHERLAPIVPGGAVANQWALRMQIDDVLQRLGAARRRRVALLFHPYQVDMVSVCREDLFVYEWYDDYAPQGDRTWLMNPSTRARRRILRNEDRMVRSAGLVITTCQVLYERARGRSPHTYLLHNGVDLERFVNADPTSPSDIDTRHPIIGFAGTSKHIVDFSLIVGCARLHPEWNFAFLGPEDVDPRFQSWDVLIAAKRQRNIHFWGIKPEVEVPRYMKQFDVCLIPYLTNSDCTAAIFPLKLNEYLALGKPVVSTDYLADLAEYKDVIYVADDNPVAFCASIESALNSPDVSRIERGRQLAGEHSWANRAEQLCRLVVSRMANGQET